MAQNSISGELNDLLITHDFDVDALSTKTGKLAVNERGVPDVSEADMFSFDWVGPTGKNYGTMVILLDQNGGMTVYFGDNLGRTMDPEDKKAWYGDEETNSTGFLEQLKNFAIRTSKIRGGFGLENLSKLKYAIAGQAALTESFYGTKKVSYSGQPTEARLMIKHTRPIAEGDKRYRYVESLFIETAEGERFRLPFRKLAGGRAMLEHVRHGGNPYDMRGQHIAETVNQLNVLSQFRRAHQGRVFEGAAGELVTETDQYYQRLNHNLKHMASSRGYNRYFESWKPADISEGDIMVEDLRGMFVETRIDPRIETALPMLAKIQQEVKAMKEADIFESWAARLVEGTWALPDTPEKMTELKTWFSQPQPLGPDAENVTDVLYPLLGDDALFDQLAAMAEEDPDADAIPIVQAWVTRNKDQSPELSELAVGFETAAPAAPPAPAAEAPPAAPAAPPVPAAPAPAQPPVAENLNAMRRLAGMSDVEEGEHDLVDIEPALHGLTREFDKFLKHGDRMERDPAYGDKWRKRYAKIAAKERARHGGDHPDHELHPDPEVNEGDNLETFEDIIRLSGAPLKENVLNDTGSTLDYIIKTYQRDIKDFVQNGDMSEHLYDALYDYYQDDMPYGVKKARTGDPYKWIGQRFYDDLQGSDMVDEGGITLRTGDDGNLEPDPTGHTLEKQMALTSTPEPYTGPTAGGAPTNLPAGINRLTGKPNVPTVPAPEPAVTPNPTGPTILQKHYQDNPLVRGLSPKSMEEEGNTIVRKVRPPKIVQTQGIPNPDIESWKFNDDPLPMTDIDSSPMARGPDLTSGEPFADEVGYDGKWIPRIHMSGVGKTHDEDEPMDECNYTMENEYCPKHGLAECGSMGMFESELARIKSLAQMR